MKGPDSVTDLMNEPKVFITRGTNSLNDFDP